MGAPYPQQTQNLLLLALLAGCCVYTALAAWLPLMPSSDGNYYPSVLGAVHYAGFLAVAGCGGSYLALRRFFKLALGITLLLALFNLVGFLPFTASVGITLGDGHLGVNPLAGLLLTVFYLLNRPAANAFIRRYILPVPSPQQASRQHREAIDQFKETFARKPDHGLQQIVQERKLVVAAVAAAQELLVERGVPATAS